MAELKQKNKDRPKRGLVFRLFSRKKRPRIRLSSISSHRSVRQCYWLPESELPRSYLLSNGLEDHGGDVNSSASMDRAASLLNKSSPVEVSYSISTASYTEHSSEKTSLYSGSDKQWVSPPIPFPRLPPVPARKMTERSRKEDRGRTSAAKKYPAIFAANAAFPNLQKVGRRLSLSQKRWSNGYPQSTKSEPSETASTHTSKEVTISVPKLKDPKPKSPSQVRFVNNDRLHSSAFTDDKEGKDFNTAAAALTNKNVIVKKKPSLKAQPLPSLSDNSSSRKPLKSFKSQRSAVDCVLRSTEEMNKNASLLPEEAKLGGELSFYMGNSLFPMVPAFQRDPSEECAKDNVSGLRQRAQFQKKRGPFLDRILGNDCKTSYEFESLLPDDIVDKTNRLRCSNFLFSLGKGRLSTIRALLDREKQLLYALKSFKKDETKHEWLVSHVLKEIDILKELSNSGHVPKFYFVTEDRSFIHLAIESFVGNLFDFYAKNYPFIRRLAEREEFVRFSLSEVICGINSIHNHHLIHRNIKPSNILVTGEGHLRISNFEFACFSDIHISSKEADFPEFHRVIPSRSCEVYPPLDIYQSPELLAHEVLDGRTDYWSMGMIAYVFLLRSSPSAIKENVFPKLEDASDQDEVKEKLKSVYSDLQVDIERSQLSRWCKLLIRNLLRPKAERICHRGYTNADRIAKDVPIVYTVEDDAFALRVHPFFHEVSWPEVGDKLFRIT